MFFFSNAISRLKRKKNTVFFFNKQFLNIKHKPQNNLSVSETYSFVLNLPDIYGLSGTMCKSDAVKIRYRF